jgi:hypothetical protein
MSPDIRMVLIMAALALCTSALVIYVERRMRTPVPDVFVRAFEGDDANSTG